MDSFLDDAALLLLYCIFLQGQRRRGFLRGLPAGLRRKMKKKMKKYFFFIKAHLIKNIHRQKDIYSIFSLFFGDVSLVWQKYMKKISCTI